MAMERFLVVKGEYVNAFNWRMMNTNEYIRPYTVHFITPEGEKIDVKATEGDTMLDLAQRYDIDLECM